MRMAARPKLQQDAYAAAALEQHILRLPCAEQSCAGSGSRGLAGTWRRSKVAPPLARACGKLLAVVRIHLPDRGGLTVGSLRLPLGRSGIRLLHVLPLLHALLETNSRRAVPGLRTFVCASGSWPERRRACSGSYRGKGRPVLDPAVGLPAHSRRDLPQEPTVAIGVILPLVRHEVAEGAGGAWSP